MFITDWLSLLKMGMSEEDAFGLFGLHHRDAGGYGYGNPNPGPGFWIGCVVIAAGCITQAL